MKGLKSTKDWGASARRNLQNVSGWRTKQRIVVFESDDWGSIRMPSKDVYKSFQLRGLPVANTQYNRFDALESNDDLTALFQVLQKHKDSHGKPACFTANMIVANPDFKKIKDAEFGNYYYEPVQETLRKYPSHDQVISLHQEGMKTGVFRPQFHGREHVQVNRWLKALRHADENMLYAFDSNTTYSGKEDYNFMESFDWDAPDEVTGQQEILRDGLRLFQETFGYASASFIAPCYTWDPRLEQTLVQEGVQYMQGGRNQYLPKGGFNNYDMKRHTLGERVNGLTYLTRNCFFEPSLVSKPDWVDYTLASIRDAFRWNKPAIICTHRINYIGFIDESNRSKNLRLLDELLARIIRKWPDVTFISSDQLGDLIAGERES